MYTINILWIFRESTLLTVQVLKCFFGNIDATSCPMPDTKCFEHTSVCLVPGRSFLSDLKEYYPSTDYLFPTICFKYSSTASIWTALKQRAVFGGSWRYSAEGLPTNWRIPGNSNWVDLSESRMDWLPTPFNPSLSKTMWNNSVYMMPFSCCRFGHDPFLLPEVIPTVTSYVNSEFHLRQVTCLEPLPTAIMLPLMP